MNEHDECMKMVCVMYLLKVNKTVISKRWLLSVFYLLLDIQSLLTIGLVKWMVKKSGVPEFSCVISTPMSQ